MAVNPIPDGYPRVIPMLAVDGAAAAIDFYATVLDAKLRVRMDGPGDKVAHAELEIGTGLVMLSDEFPEMDHRGPKAVGGTPVTMMVYVDDVDAVFQRALDNGARQLQPLEDKFYGDRSGTFEDPWGHRWDVATHVEDVPEDEMMRRAAEFNAGG